MKSRKIFGIGFQKTGTTSLRDALSTLNYKVCDGCGQANNPNIKDEVYEICFNLINEYDAFEDHPWAVLYKELDQRCPDSKFILTIRPSEQWIQSVVSHFGRQHVPLHEWIYGAGFPKGNEQLYLDRYNQHNAQVIDYFKDRPEDLLVLEIHKNFSWKEICGFLDKPVPTAKFPYANRRVDRLFLNHLRRIKHRITKKNTSCHADQ